MFKNLKIRTGLLLLLAVFSILQLAASGMGIYFINQNDKDINFL